MKTTTVSMFQQDMAAEREAEQSAERTYINLGQIGDAVASSCTADTLLGEIVGQIRSIADQDGLYTSEPEIRDEAQRIFDELHAESDTLTDDGADLGAVDSAPTPMAVLAEKMARDRSTNPDSGDAFEGMELDVDPEDAFGLVQANITAWLEEHGRWATPIEVRHRVEQLMAGAQNARPGPVSATYTVAPDGLVGDYEIDPPKLVATQLPEMPPEAPGSLKVPSDSIFAEGWADSTSLYQRAAILIARHPDDLEHLDGMSLGFLWKQKGGKSKGRPVMGQCVKAGGLVKHFSGSVFLIWLAADNIRAAGYRDREIEAVLFRNLLKAGMAEPDEDTGRGGGAMIVPPDVEAYAAELRVYGLWEASLKAIAPAFQQAPLFDSKPRDVVAAAIDALHGGVTAREDGTMVNGAGILIHDDGSPMSEAEIAEQEAAELRDDPAEDDDTPDLLCAKCGEPVMSEDFDTDDLAAALLDPKTVLCEDCGEISDEDAQP